MTYCPVWDYYTPGHAPGYTLVVMCSNQQEGHRAHYADLHFYGEPGSVYVIKDNRSKEEQHG